jgi:hypothetical protein
MGQSGHFAVLVRTLLHLLPEICTEPLPADAGPTPVRRTEDA